MSALFPKSRLTSLRPLAQAGRLRRSSTIGVVPVRSFALPKYPTKAVNHVNIVPKLSNGIKGNAAGPFPAGRGPAKNWEGKPAIIVFDDLRERCNPTLAEGRAEYKFRKFLLWLRQYDFRFSLHQCCNCRKPLAFEDSTFEHEALRGKDIDERLYDSKGKPINGASHAGCNLRRGSRRTQIWHGTFSVQFIKFTAGQFHYYFGLRCYCGKKKSSLSSCCPLCFVKLSPQLQSDLFYLAQVDAFAEALESARKILSPQITQRSADRHGKAASA